MSKLTPIGCSCYKCHKKVRHTKHFTADDGRILCYKCRTKEKAKPSNSEFFVSALGVKRQVSETTF